MKKRVKNKWLKALRSGEYKQGVRRLVNKNDEFCCLGVLCDLYLREKGEGWVKAIHYDEYFCHTQSAILPIEVQEWAGLECGDPDAGAERLTGWNDIRQKSFKQIANLIENHL